MIMTGTSRRVNNAGTVSNTKRTRKSGSGPLPAGALPVDKLLRARTPLGVAKALYALALWPVPLLPVGTEYRDVDGVTKHADGCTPIYNKWASYSLFDYELPGVYRANPEAGVGLRLGKRMGGPRIVELSFTVTDATRCDLAHQSPEGLPQTIGWVDPDGTHMLFLGDDRLDAIDPILALGEGLVLKARSVESDPTTMAVLPPTTVADGTPREWNGCRWIAPLPEAIYASLTSGGDPATQGIEPTEKAPSAEGRKDGVVEGGADRPHDGAAVTPIQPTAVNGLIETKVDTMEESAQVEPEPLGALQVDPESERSLGTSGGFGGDPAGPSSSPDTRPDEGELVSGRAAASMLLGTMPGPDSTQSSSASGSVQVAEGSDHADEARRDPEKHRVESRHDDDERAEQEHGVDDHDQDEVGDVEHHHPETGDVEHRQLGIGGVEHDQLEIVDHKDASEAEDPDSSLTVTVPEAVAPTEGPVGGSPGEREPRVEDAKPTPVIAPPAQDLDTAIGDQAGQVSGDTANDEAVGRVGAVPPDQTRDDLNPAATHERDWIETLDLNQSVDEPPTFGEVLNWVRLYIRTGQVVELRILGAKDHPTSDRPPFIVSGFFDSDHLKEMARAAWDWTEKAKGAYLLPNPIEPEMLALRSNRVEKYPKRTANDGDVIRRQWLMLDFDPDRISTTTGNKLTSDLSATDAEKAKAGAKIVMVARHLRALTWPDPIVVDSGNGYQLLYRIDEPPDDGGLVQNCLKALAARFDGDGVVIDQKVFNPARIMKMPGTMSRKGDHTPERPHRWARVLAAPAEPQVVPHELLVTLAAEAPTAEVTPAKAKTPATPSVPGAARATSPSGSPQNKAEGIMPPATTGIEKPGDSTTLARRATLYLDKLPEAVAGENGHDRTFHAACVLVVGFALGVDEAMPIFAHWNETHCKPPWTEVELRHKLDDADRKAQEEPERVGHLAGASGISTSDTSNTYPVPDGGKEPDGRSADPGKGAPTREGTSWPRQPAEPAFYGLAGDIVRAIEPNTEADSVGLLVQFLVVFGSMIGRSAYFVAESARHYTNVFAVMVGLTSKGRKGSSWEQIRRLAIEVDSKWVDHRVPSGLSSGEGLIWAVRDPIEKDEAIKDKKTGEITGYRKVMTDVGIEDKRLLAIESEFASVLKVLAREGNTLSALTRQAWDTGLLRTLTKNTPAQATGAHISIVGHITRDEVRKYLAETELANGFANRFLWVCVRRSKSLPHGGRFAPEACQALLTRLTESVAFARKQGELKRSPAADTLWEEAYSYLSEGQPGLLGAILGRAEAQVMRMACLYALLDKSDTIRVPHLLAALALWRYVEESARYIFGSSVGDRDADTLLAAIRASAEGLTRAEIYRDVFRNNKSAARIDELLEILLQHNLVERHKDVGEGPGRAAERFRARGTPT